MQGRLMAKLDYDYDYDDAPKWPRRLRITAIFLATAAVTAGLIYFLIPKSAESPVSESIPEESPVATPEDDGVRGAVDSAAGSGDAGDRKLPVSPSGSDGDAAPGEAESGSDVPSSGGEIPAEGGGDAASPASVTEQPTAEPEKGVPWIGDPPAADDGPEVIPAPPPSAEDASRRREAARKLEAKDFAGAAALAAEALSALPPGSESGRELGDMLSAANWGACVNRVQLPGVTELHLVRAGDSLSRLAVKYHTTVEALRILNHVKGDNIMVGQKLFVVPGPWRIEVRKGERRLYLYREPVGGESRLFLVFDVGIGRMGKTPTASFVVSARLRHPDWYAPDGAVYKYGEKENILGDYFLKLASSGTPGRPLLGFGIHGAPDGVGVTRSLSSGCIRMRNAEVEKIYLLSPNQTPVGFVD